MIDHIIYTFCFIYKDRWQVASHQRHTEPIAEVLTNVQCSLRKPVILIEFVSFHMTSISALATHGFCHPSKVMKILISVGSAK